MSEINHPQAGATSLQSAGVLRLSTARLVLRDWAPSDIPDLIEGLNDLSVSQWLAFVPHPYTSADAERWLAYCAQLLDKGPDRENYEFAIELASAHKVIGGVSLTRVSRLHGTAGGGIWINARYHGHGYGSEAFREKIRFAFVDLGLPKSWKTASLRATTPPSPCSSVLAISLRGNDDKHIAVWPTVLSRMNVSQAY